MQKSIVNITGKDQSQVSKAIDKLVKKVSTTTSIMKDILKIDRLTNKDAQRLSRSGSKSALHRFM